ncbi:MAG: Lipopolysaccharide export system protein LptA [Alphaproteobacteria bacterium MarineAlpha2_Bin1]|nr:MAG: Lipopolysaccharide export system protein LptA [Alphaproteobacteria bacterium MarineAlpha2_Bin1]|tara:strand:+ start:215 stop:742 length:528 start_codon:yes stop_codon:yes gene_type:complete
MIKNRLIIYITLINFFTLFYSYSHGASKYDKNLPIEITANTLEVLQNERIAIFKGSVDAKQGEILLKADILKVHYSSSKKDDSQSVSKIFAEGNVFFSTNTETAESNKGEYNVDQGLISLTGSVKLTQGKNILRGTKLKIDLKTGKNTMIGETKPLSETTKDGRVKGLFVPNKRK